MPNATALKIIQYVHNNNSRMNLYVARISSECLNVVSNYFYGDFFYFLCFGRNIKYKQ